LTYASKTGLDPVSWTVSLRNSEANLEHHALPIPFNPWSDADAGPL
jgi:hypothetical protein